MKDVPYLASEDSALLRSAVEGRSGESCIEIGAGNGGTLVALCRGFSLVVGTDLTRPIMSDWRSAGADFVIADRASCFRSSVFDLVTFNPPYLPRAVEDRATDGGSDLEVPLAFLADGLRVLRPAGEVVWLLNDEASLGPFERLCSAVGFGISKIASRRLFYEALSVYSASNSDARG